MQKLIFLLLLGWTITTSAQPYVDIIQTRLHNAFRSSSRHNRATPFDHEWIGNDLPLKLSEGTYLLLSPYYENWLFDSVSGNPSVPGVQGLAFPIGLLFPVNKKLSWIVNLQLRTQGENLFVSSSYQAGLATIASYAVKPDKKWRAGLYLSGEFFGLFVMPLVGADWKIDDRNYLFGILPGRLAWEHRYTKRFFAGANFRAITSSYRLADGHFLRLDDNRVSIYADWYPMPSLCFTLEPGYGLFRQLRTGDSRRHYLGSDNWGDGFFIQLNASLRRRL